MDIFTLTHNGVDSYDEGEIVNGVTSKLWVERYRFPGECTFKCPALSYYRNALPIGSLVSHTDTKDIMMIENHEITESKDKGPELTITGRSLDSFLEQRVATDDDQGFNPTLYDGTAWPYVLTPKTPWSHAVRLIELQLETGTAIKTNFAVPDVSVLHNISSTPDPDNEDWWVEEDREIERGPLHKAVLDILDEVNAGIMIQRPVPGVRTKIQFLIHMGVEKQSTVQFNYERGDIETARYLWSNKQYKNAVFVGAKYDGIYTTKVNTSGTVGFNKRVMYLNASDINMKPGSSAEAWSEAKLEKVLTQRGKRAINKKRNTSIIL
jgi:Siphovirus ReqiPepy6 Gp37-like protein